MFMGISLQKKSLKNHFFDPNIFERMNNLDNFCPLLPILQSNTYIFSVNHPPVDKFNASNIEVSVFTVISYVQKNI